MPESEENPSRQKFSIDEDVAGYPLEKFTGSEKESREELSQMHDQAGRVPPQAQDVERSVLGAMLIEREAIPSAVEVLPANAFYDGRHQEIYEAILDLFERDNPVDLVTVTEELKRRDALEEVGGGYYLSRLTSEVASAANVEYHARIIAEKSILRKMIERLTRLVGEAYQPGADAFDMLDKAEQQIFQLSESQLRRSSSDIGTVLKETMERLEQIDGQEEAVTGVPSGFPELDRKTSGWQDSDLIILAARPSMGKTALALNLARNAARHPRKSTSVAIFSLEMSSGQLAQRLLTSEARVDAQDARTGRLNEDDWPRLARAAGVLNDLDIYIDDTPALTVLELRAKCRRLKAEHDVGLIVVDYLQLMHGTGDAQNREQEIAKISRSLKSLAKELETPVIALSQLNRGVENRGGDKRPQLSDLRESGCLTGDTRIPRADTGERIRMEELAGRDDFEVWALDPETREIEARPVSNCFSTGVKKVYELTTRSGRRIRASANHKFLTVDGWRRLDELEEGDPLAVPAADWTPELTASIDYARRMASVGLVASSDEAVFVGPVGTRSRVRADALRGLARSDVYWDRIASIAPDGEEEVYDITVPGHHNFVADDVIVHNSIEQDADVVMFIYRAERYDITVDEHGNSTEGMAEIIIGKQRNGPVGTVKLSFVKKYARFESVSYRGDATPGPSSGGGGGPSSDGGGARGGDAPF